MTQNLDIYDIAVAWTWPPDEYFIGLIVQEALQRGLRALVVDRTNVASMTQLAAEGRIGIRWYLDRASDEDEAFVPLSRVLSQMKSPTDGVATRIVNPLDLARRAMDKATMHLEFLAQGIHVPFTRILSPYAEQPELVLTHADLEALGSPFIIKPANTTGGGVGVVMGAKSVDDVLLHRRSHPRDKYLLQQTIHPAYLSESRGWFRVFFFLGELIPCWWDDQTHLYEEVTPDEERWHGLDVLRTITGTIAGVCRLGFFSTEIAITSTGTAVVVDYVNETCDMRLQSQHPDGVPDAVVQRIVRHFVAAAARNDLQPSVP